MQTLTERQQQPTFGRKVINERPDKATARMNDEAHSPAGRKRRAARWGNEDVRLARELGLSVEEVRGL